MKAKHTPGPWIIDVEVNNENWIIPINSSEPVAQICAAHYSDMGQIEQSEETIANAKLIAAAPELLEALQKCLKAMQNSNCDSRAEDIAKEAIKKATE